MEINNEDLHQLLQFDPLDTAERLTGRTWGDPLTAALGFGLAMEHNDRKNDILTARGDTKLINKLDRYVEIIEAAGFIKVLQDSFIDTEDAGTRDDLMIYARPDGLLLSFDTFSKWSPEDPAVNSARLCYNWHPGVAGYWGIISSGHRYFYAEDHDRPGPWVGYHDAREALLHNIAMLEANGTFLRRWVERPSMWFLGYGESRTLPGEGYVERIDRYDEITAARIERLPSWVKEMITP